MSHVINRIQRVAPELVNNYLKLSSATVHEASGGQGALSSRIKPIFPAMRVCGPAVTVKVRPGDNLLLHKAIYVAQPGDLVLGDRDGVVVVKREEALDVYRKSMAREEKEAKIKEKLMNGETTLDIYGFRAIITARGLTEE